MCKLGKLLIGLFSKKSKSTVSFEDLKIEFQKKKDVFNSLTGDINLQDRLYKMIEYSIKRQDWYEDQKQRILQIGLGIFGASAAGIVALIIKISDNNKFSLIFEVFLWLFVLSLFLTAILIIWYYNSKIEIEHPYRKVVDIRSWFFKYNFKLELTDKISRNKERAKREVSDVVDAFESFTNRWHEYATTDKGFIKEDIEQVFILQLLQKYRSHQLKILSRILYYGIFISSLFLFIAIISFSASPNQSPVDNAKSDSLQIQIDNKVYMKIIKDSVKIDSIKAKKVKPVVINKTKKNVP